jgi:Na+-driven multidrug efflux pump
MSIIQNFFLLKYGGTVAVAAFSVIMYVDSIVGMLIFGMCDSLQPALSYCYGANLIDKVKALFKRIILGAVILSAVSLLFMYFALFISAVVRPAVKGRVLIMSAISVPLLLVYCFTDSFFSRVLTIYSAEHTTLYYEFAEHVTSRILPEFLYDSIVFLILVIPVTFLWTALSKSSIKGYKMF